MIKINLNFAIPVLLFIKRIMKKKINTSLLLVFIGFCLSMVPWFHTWRQYKLSDRTIFELNKFDRSYYNPKMIIKQKSFIFYCLNYAYSENYLVYKYRKYSNTEWQEIHWNEYAEFYSRSRHSAKENLQTQKIINKILSNPKIKNLINIGTNDFNFEKQFSPMNKNIIFYGLDFTKFSEDLFDIEIKKNFRNIKYIKSNVLKNLHILINFDIIFSRRTLMHFDESEINLFFQNLPKNKFVFIIEIFNNEKKTINYKERDYTHDFEYLIFKYKFKLIENKFISHQKGNAKIGFFYFQT